MRPTISVGMMDGYNARKLLSDLGVTKEGYLRIRDALLRYLKGINILGLRIPIPLAYLRGKLCNELHTVPVDGGRTDFIIKAMLNSPQEFALFLQAKYNFLNKGEKSDA